MGWSIYPLHLPGYFYKKGGNQSLHHPTMQGVYLLYCTHALGKLHSGNGVVIVSLPHLHKYVPNSVVVKEDKEGKLEALPS
eukprot:7120227-Ditylum_brightwellii.AAC.1